MSKMFAVVFVTIFLGGCVSVTTQPQIKEHDMFRVTSDRTNKM